MLLEVARILQETESASDLLSDKAGLIMHNLARCAQLGGDPNKKLNSCDRLVARPD